MSRVLAARTLLIKGAQDAAILAAQYPDMDIDIPESGTLPDTPDYSSPEYQKYAAARQKIIDDAVSIPTSTLLNSMGVCPVGIPCNPRTPRTGLQVITTYDLPQPGAAPAFYASDAAVFRPDRWDTTIPVQRRDKNGTVIAATSGYPAEYQLNTATSTNIHSPDHHPD